jgi:O-antigen/teichoic acid export membrane protein
MMEANDKQIYKNTIYLYIRQIIIMALAFVSTRIVLETLGVDDYGLYNVVGGFVSLFTILNNVLQSATRRFLAVAIGRNQNSLIKNVFNTALLMHCFIAGIAFVLLETVGLWFLNNKLNIDPERLWAANWAFQFSVCSVLVSIIQTPYTAAVTAHEKFNIYAFLSIFDVGAKIIVLFFLVYFPYDKLIVYSALMLLVSQVSQLLFRTYCKKHFNECQGLTMHIDRALFKEMLRFSGWDSFGNITSIVNAHGLSILLNVFFNTAINAARGIANMVTTTTENFVTGFVTAAEPQLVKYYAKSDYEHFIRLIFNISTITLFILSLISVPIFMELDFVLKLWLGSVPEFTSAFVKITIIANFVRYSNTMLLKGNVAMGCVKEVSLYMLPIGILELPIIWLVLKLGWPPVAVYWVGIIPSLLRMFIDLIILNNNIRFPVLRYLWEVFIKNTFLVAVACIIPYVIRQQLQEGWLRFFVVCIISVVCTIVIMYFFALNKETRQLVWVKVKGRFPTLKLKSEC